MIFNLASLSGMSKNHRTPQDTAGHHRTHHRTPNGNFVQTNGWIPRSWKNNNAESYNHVLKAKNDWKQLKRATDLVQNVKASVQVQMKDLRRALYGEGNFSVHGPFTRLHLTYHAWQNLTTEQRTDKFSRFLADSGKRQSAPTVTESDGGLTVLNTSSVARKPGQRRRVRATKTTSK